MDFDIEERRRSQPRRTRALPWVVGTLLLVATLVVTLVERNHNTSGQAAARDAATTVFSNSVAATEHRLGLEQAKLTLFIEGVASFASISAGNEELLLNDYVSALPLDRKIPAVRLVVVADQTGQGTILEASSLSGDSQAEVVGSPTNTYEGLDSAIATSETGAMPAVGATNRNGVEGVDASEWIWLAVAVPGVDGRFVAAQFEGGVFLSPALDVDGTMASLRPFSADFVISRPSASPVQVAGPASGSIGRSPSGDRFTYAGEVDVFGSPWRLDVLSSADFLEIPNSHDSLFWPIGGTLLSIAVVALLLMQQRGGRRQLESSGALTRSSRRFTTGFDNAPIGMAEVDVHGRVVRSNNTMRLQLGRDVLDGVELPNLLHPDDSSAHAEQRDRLDNGVAPSAQLDVRYLRPDGGQLWVTESISALDRVGDPDRHYLIQQLDTTDRHEAEVTLHTLAFSDSLTGLPNKAALMQQLEQQLVVSESSGDQFALLFIDLDLFKVVNDSLGHGAGDCVIKVIADRITAALPAKHQVARFGGDEFTILCPGIGDSNKIEEFSVGLLTSIGEPIDLAGVPVSITASVGYTFSSTGDTPETLLRDADAAMYKAKANGRNRVMQFVGPMRREAVERFDIETSLRLAIDRDEFDIYYQPMVELATDRIVGVEALLRWEHPDRGLLEPGAFLDVARESGLLDEIDAMTLAKAWKQLDQWVHQRAAAKEWHLAVNCSSQWFQDGRLRTLLPEVLDSTSLDPSRLWLELTESDLLHDTKQTTAELDALHSIGVKVALDDFGTGFSSLSYLSRFDIDRLKIDQSFIQSLGRSDADEAIVGAVVEMANALGIPTVAEGTESVEQLEVVRRLGANYAQGFLLGEPQSVADLDVVLAGLS